MKIISVRKFATFIALAALALGAAALWSARQSIAASPVSIDAKATEGVFVQDIDADQGLRMKLIMHRPGHALVPAIKADQSC